MPRRSAPPGSADDREAAVREWVAAFNARDYDRVLAPLKSEVALHPLRLEGIGSVYRGHVGLLQWLAERVGESPFCAIFEFGGPQIVSIRHYFGHAEALAETGAIDQPTADRGRE